MADLSAAHERRLLWLLALTQFTVIMDFMVMMPLGPQIMHAFQISPARFATAVSVYSWCSGLSGLLAATYIDRFDRRSLLLWVYAWFALSNLACALAPGYGWLLMARAFAGFSGGVMGAIVMAIVSDVIPLTRRGTATGIVMTSFSLAAVLGVPVGVLLGAHFSWAAPFLLLVLLSSLIWAGGLALVPSLAEHLRAGPAPLSRVLPQLWLLLTRKPHLKAFLLTFWMLVAHMLVIPFISPTLVANHGVTAPQLSLMYMLGGGATFFTARRFGKLTDRLGAKRTFRLLWLVSLLPVLMITHLPDVSFYLFLPVFPFFMVMVSGRMIPMQTLMTTVTDKTDRGAFLSANSAIQSLGSGCGAWIGGLMLSSGAQGQILGYGQVGWLAVALALFGMWWVGRVPSQPPVRSTQPEALPAEA
ncbi:MULTISPECIES: MFS transporter [unclassified Paludibacterium]|uniref:MFS transporter n=1 Tax=unclassified Paludibacterium TaxID=2618429 RepID=UPI001C04687F|nr:MFS transporter [Paludibacterium sp. B53371]BEV72703.1 MFS transporter [Paludibacterium sp. THUN1379]